MNRRHFRDPVAVVTAVYRGRVGEQAIASVCCHLIGGRSS
jgi:hypothetical protein